MGIYEKTFKKLIKVDLLILKIPILIHLVKAENIHEAGILDEDNEYEADRFFVLDLDISMSFDHDDANFGMTPEMGKAIRSFARQMKDGSIDLNEETNLFFRAFRFSIINEIKTQLDEMKDMYDEGMMYHYDDEDYYIAFSKTTTSVERDSFPRHWFFMQLWEFKNLEMHDKKMESLLQENYKKLTSIK